MKAIRELETAYDETVDGIEVECCGSGVKLKPLKEFMIQHNPKYKDMMIGECPYCEAMFEAKGGEIKM